MTQTYATLLSTDSYLDGVIGLYRSLRMHSSLPFVCICSKGLSKTSIENLHNQGISTLQLTESALDKVNLPPPSTYKGLEHWNYTFDKLLIWELEQYDKIVFLDSDMMVCSNIDELFEKEDMSAVQAGRFLCQHWTRINSGCMVLIPNKTVARALLDSIQPTMLERQAKGYGTGDQDVINYYYRDWPERDELHLSEEYNVFFMNIPQYKKANMPTPKIIHFVGGMKPWNKLSIIQELIWLLKMCYRHRECLSYYFKYKRLLKKTH